MVKFQHKKRLNFLFALLVLITSVMAPHQALSVGMSTNKYKEECRSLLSYSDEYRANKWWDKPFEIVSKAAVEMGEETFAKAAPSAAKLVGIGLGLWIAIYTMKVVGSMTESDPLENLTRIGGMLFKGLIAVGLLRNQDFFFTYFVSPIMDMGAGIAGLGGGGGSGLGSVVAPLKAILTDVHDMLARNQGLGSLAKCISYIYQFEIGWFDIGSPLPDPSVWANGCAVYVVSWIMMMVWPILIFDALFRLGITAALCPLFIASWVFPSTASFAMKGFNSFLNVAFFYVCLNFAVEIGTKLLAEASGLKYLEPDTAEAKTQTVCILKIGGGEGLSHCSAYLGQAGDQTGLLVLAACAFYSFLFLKQATVFANYFSDAGFSNDTAFQGALAAGKTAQDAGVRTVKGAAWASDKVSEGKDRKAARIVESGRASGGNFASDKDRKRYENAENRLKKRGFLGAGGTETVAYGNLVKNGKRRQFMNIITGGQAYQNNAYKSWSGPRTDEELKKINDKIQADKDNETK